MKLEGKRAIVTGGSRGIGKAIARTFAQAGASVMISSRKPDACEAAAREIGHGVQWFAANAGDRPQAEACVEAAMQSFGGIDILVNNAGTNPYGGPTIDIDLPRWEKTILVNLTAPLMWSQLVWRRAMSGSSGGCSVINMASVGAFVTSPSLGAYDITKAALA
jgi:NAD(P)-dependent dehydrogenase (short-subunit alcohol dehydrogenase family)